MNLELNIFDVFTNTIPGSLYVALAAYVAERFGWVNLSELRTWPSILVVVSAILICYLVGQVTYELGHLVGDGLADRWLRVREDVRAEFTQRNPDASHRSFVDKDIHLLLAAIEVRQFDLSREIHRLRAIGLMLRNVVPPLILGILVSVVQILFGPNRLASTCTAVLLAGATAFALRGGVKFRRWAIFKTLELCYWLDDIDAPPIAP